MVAELIQKQNIGTLLFDVLTEEEDKIYENRFNIDLLVSRLIETTEWLMNYNEVKFAHWLFEQVPVRPRQYEQPPILNTIKAVVSRGGRPDGF
jgi:hypothetical protein